MPKNKTYLVSDEIKFERYWLVEAKNQEAAIEAVESGEWSGMKHSEQQLDADCGYQAQFVKPDAIEFMIEHFGLTDYVEDPKPEKQPETPAEKRAFASARMSAMLRELASATAGSDSFLPAEVSTALWSLRGTIIAVHSAVETARIKRR